MRAVLIVNPRATSTTPGGRDVLAHAVASEVALDVVETGHRGHATQAADKAARDGVDLVIAHGGDGTVNEVVNGMLAGGPAAAPALAVVPGGSANVFARALGISRDPVEATHQLLAALAACRSRSISLGRAESRWFTFNAGMGWDAEVVAAVDRMRRKRATTLLYARTALSHYVWQALRGPELTVEVAGQPPIARMRTAFISNTDPWTYLGGRPIRLNPGCTFDGGLGVFALASLWTPTVLRVLAQAMTTRPDPRGGRLLRRDDVPLVRVSSDIPVRFQVDGDLIGERTSVDFSSVPDALRVVA